MYEGMGVGLNEMGSYGLKNGSGDESKCSISMRGCLCKIYVATFGLVGGEDDVWWSIYYAILPLPPLPIPHTCDKIV